MAGEIMASFSEIIDFQHLFLWLCVFVLFSVYTVWKKPKYNLPPGPRGLPILGISAFLGSYPHQELSKLGKKYGGIFSARLGRETVIVVTESGLIKQLLGKNSAADRPPNMFELIPNGVGVSSLSGPEWIEQRRYTIIEMKNLGFGRSLWEEMVQTEVSEVLELLIPKNGEPVDIFNILSASISNNILSLVNNQRLPMGHPKRDVIDRGIESAQTIYNPSGIVSNYPGLFKICVKLGLIRLGEELKDILNLNKCVREEIEKVKQEGRENHSYISTYLNEIEKNQTLNGKNYFNENNLIGNVQSLMIAGSDTTFVSLIWLLLAMASYPDVQEKVHQELDSVVRKTETIQWIDRQKLPYCLASIMEGQRWRTVIPLNLLHRSNEHIVINGYDIPKGTNIITVLWAVHNDARYWKDPEAFKPERFLTSDQRIIMEPEAYLPFSYGKRSCIGKTVALVELFQYFLSFMRRFQVLPASPEVDLQGISGLSFQPKRQLLRFVPRY